MISINGKNFSGSNLVITNGRVIIDDRTVTFQKFDERKGVDCSNIDKITIDSAIVNVNVSASNSSKIEAHLYGEANVDGNVNFDVRVVNCELKITLQLTGNCFIGNLNLDITVPKKTFNVIATKSLSANITLNEGISTDCLKVMTQSGDLETNATFSNVSISTMSGDVELYIDATQDINVEVSTASGDVSTEFNNIGHINLSTSSMSGNVRNRHKGNIGFTADVDISTMSGDIKIR